MDHIVACVPNFSEGRNLETVQALAAAVSGVPGVCLLDQTMDPDHNRAVLTFAGKPDAVAEAAFCAVKRAKDLIDLRSHRGEHPRVGATDVVPFVPIKGVTMEDCVALAQGLGQRIGSELEIPVFLYQQAAARSQQTNLEEIRRGGLVALTHRMETEPGWSPDYGPAKPHPTAGVTMVGARLPLIAFNVNLMTHDLNIAKAIAKKVRYSSGGLPCVKAIGVRLASRGLVQVSMNLTDFEQTSIETAFETVKREAGACGVRVLESEIIGLVPQKALHQVIQHRLQLTKFDTSQVLETRLAEALKTQPDRGTSGLHHPLASMVSRFIEAVAAPAPTPAGGSAAAATGALAAALGLKACRVSARSSGWDLAAGSAGILTSAEQRLTLLREKLEQSIDDDAEAYAALLQAYRVAKSDASRGEVIAQELKRATESPLEIASSALDVGRCLHTILPHARAVVQSDVRVGLMLAVAAVQGACATAEENAKSKENQEVVDAVLGKLQEIKQNLVELQGLC